MRKTILTIIGLTTLLFNCEKSPDETCGLTERDDLSPKTLNVLFFGNSFTMEIPGIITKIALSKGDTIKCKASTPGGFCFRQHLSDRYTFSLIKEKKWDYIVLQESGWMSAFPESMVDTMVYPFADSLYKVIKNNCQSTQVLLYMPHAYKDGADWCYDSIVCTYRGMQARMKNVYQKMGQRLGVPVIPVGVIWSEIIDANPNLNLFSPDRDHANDYGSYVDACGIYCYLFRRKLDNAYAPAGFSQQHVELIQNTTENVLFNCKPDWRNYQY